MTLGCCQDLGAIARVVPDTHDCADSLSPPFLGRRLGLVVSHRYPYLTCRAALCEKFAFLDLRLDQVKNAESPLDEDISALDATVRILVIHAQED